MGERPPSGNAGPPNAGPPNSGSPNSGLPAKALPRGRLRHVGAVVPVVARPAFRRQSPAAAQIMLDWSAIVGPALARETAPRQLAAGTLTIACSGPMALELQHLSVALLERINAYAGGGTVQRLRFVRNTRRVAAPPPRPTQAAGDGRAEAAVARVPDGALRDALLALGRAVLTRR